MDYFKTVLVIPTLNESQHISRLLHKLMAENENMPIWVYDGGSSDRTRAIVMGIARKFAQVRMFANNERTQAAALNHAAARAVSLNYSVIIRIDAHAAYPHNYIVRLINTLNSTHADSVVVPRIATGGNRWQNAAKDLQASWLGHGGAAHRTTATRGLVAHGHHAAFRLDKFMSLGGYDSNFTANEDVEFDLRMIKSGGRIFLESELPIAYFPRLTLWQTAAQMYRNGRYRMKTAVKHHQKLALRQMLPLIAAILVAMSLVGAIANLWMLAPAAVYVFAVLTLAMTATKDLAPAHVIRIFALAVVSHMSFGAGIIHTQFGTIRKLRSKRRFLLRRA